jgi:hypothetical protein
MKWIIFAMWFQVVSFVAQAQLTFTTNNGAITITGGTGTGGVVSIPSMTNGWPVTSIGTNAFYNGSLTSVTIPDSVTNIGSFAFFGCSSMTNITIPTNLNSIQDFTFYGCSDLTSFAIPGTVVTIGMYPFYNCSGLTSVVIPTNVTSIGEYAFSGCTGVTNFTIPDSVTSLGYAALSACTSLTNVTIPSSLTSLSGYLFFDCYNLRGIAIPNTVTNIGYFTFGDCTSLAGITIPTNVTSLGAFAFYDCTSLTNITIPDGITSIGEATFSYCMSLLGIVLPGHLTNIGGGAFDQCVDLGSITIPNAVTNIGDSAFLDCVGLTNLTLSSSLTSIGADEFSSCIGLSNITIPAGVTNIGHDAFAECNGLTSLTIPSGVLSLGSQAFALCPALSSVYFDGNAPSADSSVLSMDGNPTVYYYAGTSGWSNTFAGCPAIMLDEPNPSGSLQVTINPPEAAAAGAYWRVDQGIPQPGGATVTGMSVGSHAISFSTIGHWTTPTNLTVTIMASQTAATNATYILDADLGTYAKALLSLHPVAYWQLNETNPVPAADVITNSGSLGLFGTGFPFNNVAQGVSGMVNHCASFSNPSLDVTYLGSYVAVPWNPILNPPGPFTVEFWVKPNQNTSDYFCPVSSIDASQNAAGSRFGWVFYEGPGNQWVFRMGNFNGYVAELTGGTTQTNVWQHVAGVYDGANVTLYVNGSPVAGPAPVSGYGPNTNATAALCIGATSFGNRTFDGSVDELAVYASALSAFTIAAHCQAAFTNNQHYDTQILANHPVGYWNLDEPSYTTPPASSLPGAFNLGSLSSAANGIFEPGSVPGVTGVQGVGFGPANWACAFQASSYIDVPGSSFQFSGPLTLIAWVKSPPGLGATQSLVSQGTNSCRLTMDASGHPHFADAMQSFGDLVAPNAINDNQWHLLAGTYDGTNTESLFVDGQLSAQSSNATASPVVTGEDFWIGGDPDPGAFQFFNGAIDEVGAFTNALTANQLLWLFSAASNGAFLNAPKYSASSGSITLSWSAVPNLTYELEVATNLGQQSWSVLYSNLWATNTAFELSLPAGSDPQHFYRVLVLP